MSSRRRIKKRKSRKRLAYGVIAVTFILLCFLIYFSLQHSNQPPQAAIVDQLNFTGQSNPTFVNTCINILESGGLTWKYYRGEDITVNFYRNLPSYGTSLIILRVHSAIMGEKPPLGLFTSELYTDYKAATTYREDVLHYRLVKAFFTDGGEEYFGIVPKFIEESMKGEFKNAIIIMMGCDGLGYINRLTGKRVEYTDMAEAFIKKGAKVYIGWDGPVGVNHTDQATIQLLEHLITENRRIKEAVDEISLDPSYDSKLGYYPKTVDVENYTVPNLRSSLAMNVAYTSLHPRHSKVQNRRAYICSARVLDLTSHTTFSET